MKQLLQNIRNGETIVEEVPIPNPQKGEALVHIAASLVSAGTERMVVEFAEKTLISKARSRPDLVHQVLDKARREGVINTLDAVFNRLDQPMPLGYSSAGTIVALGENLHGFQPGQRVACAGGGYAVHAEYACVPQNLLTAIPDGVDFESAAFTTLGAIALHGFRLANLQLGESVAVIGLGLLGLLTVGIAKAAGCLVLGVDLNLERVALADRLGAKAVLREQAEEAAASFSRGRGCDAILICADTPSADPIELAGTIARDRGKVVAIGAVGLKIPRKVYFEKELTFLNSRSYGPGRYDPSYEENGHDYPIGYVRWTEGRNLEAFVELLASNRLDVKPLVTHRFPIEQATQAYELIKGKNKEPYLGILLQYPEEAEEEISISAQKVTGNKKRIPITQSKSVKLGVLGAGNFATSVMLPILKKIHNVELVGIASASGTNAQIAAHRYGFQYATSNDGQIINDPEINTIAILTRHHMHAQQVIAALSAGKHVFCEKPLALNEEELQKIEKAFLDEKPHGLLMVGFNRRFAPLAHQLKGFLNNSGEPMVVNYRVNAGMLPRGHWANDPEQGGGRIIGEGCHFIDFLTFMTGEIPQVVSAKGLPDDERYCMDNVVLIYSFSDGSIGTVTYVANGDKTFPKERVEIFCGGKVGALDDFRLLELVSGGKRRVFRSRLRQEKGHYLEWEAFSASILKGEPPPIPYEQLFSVTRASFASVRALRSGIQERIWTAEQGSD